MAGKEWDDVDLEAERPAGAKPVVKKRGGRAFRMGWLLSLFFAAGGLAVAGIALDERSQQELATARARDEAAMLRRELFATQDKLQKADRERVAEAAKAAQLDEQLQIRGAEKDSDAQLITDLKAKLDEKDGDVSSAGRQISVNFVDEILFASGEAELSAHGKEVLSKVGAVLKDLKDQQILVGGHTDDKRIHNARFASNWELSAARAVNVARHLVEVVGVDPRRVVAAGYSEFHPRGTDRAKNRRIELLLTPSVEVKR